MSTTTKYIEQYDATQRAFNYHTLSMPLDGRVWTDGIRPELVNELLKLGIHEVKPGTIIAPAVMAVAENAFIDLPPRGTPVQPALARFWGRLVSGSLAVSCHAGTYEVYEKSGRGWRATTPAIAYGDMRDQGFGYRTAIWAVRALQLGRQIDPTAITTYSQSAEEHADGKGIWHATERRADSTMTATPATIVRPPQGIEFLLDLQREAFGEAFESLAMAQAYLLDPSRRAQHIILLEDAGGSGKTSWMHAFSRAYPGVAAEDLDISALSHGGFEAGSALTAAIGRRVGLVDESASVSMKSFAPLAALSTGTTRTVRFGGGVVERHHFELKIVIASNAADDLDSRLGAVSRRIIRVPMQAVHNRTWWEHSIKDDANSEGLMNQSWSLGSRWDAIFSTEGMDAMTTEGERLLDAANGVLRQGQSILTHLSQDAQEVLADLEPRLYRDVFYCDDNEPMRAATAISDRKIARELKSIAGIGSTVVSIHGKSTRVLGIVDAVAYNRICEQYKDLLA